ncbi:MAG: DUF1573 domain-containing protein [Cytophagales bacterium]|nr:DUF1573 domain-containing protein [Cytophagales bacterium]
MKQTLSIVLLGIAVAVVAHVAPITWKTTSLELGQVEIGETKELSFEFTNEGDEPVRILEAKGSCGCTVVDFSKNEIKSGETATIQANFKSSKVGVFKKSVKVKTTASGEYTQLWFSGEVVD